MARLIDLLRWAGVRLGNGGAIANAAELGRQRTREAWTVASLERSLDGGRRGAPLRRPA
jgi:hypothetical protein